MKIGKPSKNKIMMIKMISVLFLTCTGFLASKYQSNQSSSINSAIINANSEQLDLIMTSWLDSFVKHQSQGKDMNQADELAISDIHQMIANTPK